MRVVPAWQQQIPDKDSLKSIVYDIAYSPDGNYLAAACGARVLVFNAGSGEQLHTLKGHKDQAFYSNLHIANDFVSDIAFYPGSLRIMEQRRRFLRVGRCRQKRHHLAKFWRRSSEVCAQRQSAGKTTCFLRKQLSIC
jgi:WD40 repeat protein